MAFANPVGPVAVTPSAGLEATGDNALRLFVPVSTPGDDLDPPSRIDVQADAVEIAADVSIVAGLMSSGNLEVAGTIGAGGGVVTPTLTKPSGAPWMAGSTWAGNVDANSRVTITHGVGHLPAVVIVYGDRVGYVLTHSTRTTTTIVANVRDAAGALVAAGTPLSGFWLCLYS